MKLTWKPRTTETGDPLVLGDNTRDLRGAGCKVIQSFLPQFAQQVSVNAYPRGEEVETFGRGNIQTALAAVIHYEFRTVGECSAWAFRLGQLVRSQGTLEINHGDDYRSVVEGVWQSIVPGDITGVALTVTFQFLGGLARPGTATTNQAGVAQ